MPKCSFISGFVASLVVAAVAPLSAEAASLNYYNLSAGGATVANQTDGSALLTTTTASNSKASIVFAQGFSTVGPFFLGVTGQLGTLGDLTSLTVDFDKLSGGNAAATFAVRLWTNTSGTEALVWENAYNGSTTVPLDTWQTVSIDGDDGKFWQRANSKNFNGGAQAFTLDAWRTSPSITLTKDGTGATANNKPLSSATKIYGIEISYGSGLGAFSGLVGDINLAFGTTTYTSSTTTPADIGGGAAVPLPAAAMSGTVLLGLTALRRRRA